MKIHDSLRQECMPEMVYSICKLAGSKSYDKDELKKLITLNSSAKESTDQFNKVFNFMIACEFVGNENSNNKVTVNFTPAQLSSFRNFRYAIFSDVFKTTNTVFTSSARWYLVQNKSVFSLKTTADFLTAFPQDLGVKSEEFLLGFRFWMSALGLTTLQQSGNGSALIFATNNILLDWLNIEKPFKKGKAILAKEFFDILVRDCPVFDDCIDGNDINTALSMGLRVLHLGEAIELKHTTDSGDTWHLTKSISNYKTNNITEIIVR